ncbi:MAG: YdgA family protein [Colwellia sp.]|nr:YdgA family protein [Colwellia sp.]
MKKTLIALGIVVGAALVLPKIVGSIVETEHQAMLADMSDNDTVSVTSKSFTANWFGGSAVTEMTVHLQDVQMPDVTFKIEEQLLFGPVIFADDGLHFALSHSTATINFKELGLDEEIVDFINDKIKITGLLTFSKDVVSRIDIAEMSKEVDGNNIVFHAASGEISIANKTHLTGDFKWGGMEVNSSDAHVVVGPVTMDIDQEVIRGDYYSGDAISIGDANFVMSSLKINDETGNEVVNVKNVLMNAVSSVNDDLMKVNFTYHIDEINSMGQRFEHANLSFVFDNLDVDVMTELNTAFTELSTAGSDDAFSEQNIQKLTVIGAKLLEKNPIIKITDLSVETPEGKVVSDLQVSMDKDKFDAANFMTAMMALKAKAKANAPEALFAKFGLTPMIDMYVEQGFLVRADDKLSFDVSFSQGQLQVNGKIIPL